MRSITDGLEATDNEQGSKNNGPGLRDKLNSSVAGPGGMVVLLLLAGGLLFFVFSRFQSATGPDPSTVVEARIRLMDPTNGNMSWQPLVIGKPMPEGLYPVEYCWNNHNDDIGVPVILNVVLFDETDPRHDEPTTCPCCGALVFGRNPKPQEFAGMTPKDYDTNQAPACTVDYFSSVAGR